MRYRLLLFGILLLLASTTVYAETLKIGLNYPQTGRYKDQGLQQRLGAFLAVDEINKAGGIMGRPVHLYLHVKVKPGWDDERDIYREMGLDWVD